MTAGRAEIEGFLPHRDPFLFVDEVRVIDAHHIEATRAWKGDEFFFAGHFPHYPVVPGVILVETLAQAGGVGVKLQGITAAGTFFLASVGNVKFRRQVRPGDVFEMKIHNLRASARLIKQKGLGYVDGELAIEADWLCIVGEETA
ncbi:MAG: 3-hydroxyacyl-ACP dehydratase FabZ [Spirochaetales bacterium]|nr:3-hydroxyacyl-ACP dehydratase FabZ [Spirochaetales bacterium]MBP7264233.1 3-hydroxyacyl-ACP dehydratase FabZ [Spirochaetia bacterium]